MRLDDTRLRPGETEEQRQQRLLKAAKYTKMAKDSRALAKRSALASRMIRLVFLVICGMVLTAGGIHSFNQPTPPDSRQGTLSQYLGPYGNAIGMTVLGLLILGLSGYFLLRYVRVARNLPPVSSPEA